MSPLDQSLLHFPSSTNLREQLPDHLTPSRLSSLLAWSLPEYNIFCTRVCHFTKHSRHVSKFRTVYSFPFQFLTPLYSFSMPGFPDKLWSAQHQLQFLECLTYFSPVIPLVMPHIRHQFMSRKSTSLMLPW